MNEDEIHRHQYKLVYALIVAGKSAAFAEKAMQRLLFYCAKVSTAGTLFACLQDLNSRGELRKALEIARTGNYAKLTKALPAVAALSDVSLATCTPDDLETIHGIGPKTSRFFILWTRPDARYAALDVHVLRWLRSLGHDVPTNTPANRKRYAQIEQTFLREADKREMTPRQLDYATWEQGRRKISKQKR